MTSTTKRTRMATTKTKTTDSDPPEEVPVNTLNEYAICSGQNMDNTTFAMNGRAKFIRQGQPSVPTFRTKQAAFRYAAYLITMAEILPDEEGAHDFEEVIHAIQNA